MEKINNEQFGRFLMQLRKEKELTQKQLAEKLYVSDKAVSKWERGLSLPDISLLMPLAQIFQVTITELLSGKRINATAQLTVEEVECLMEKTFVLSKEENIQYKKQKQNRILIFTFCTVMGVLELILFRVFGYTWQDLYQNLGTIQPLMLIFGAYFTFFVKETLPVYYDENRIGFYHDGVFRMNIVGVRFHNSNWPPIVQVTQATIMIIFALVPFIYLGVSFYSLTVWENIRQAVFICSMFGLFIPIYVTAKKYE